MVTHSGKPLIAVSVLCDGDRVIKVSLSFSSSFSYAVLNAGPKLKQSLIHWLKAYCQKEESPCPITIPMNSFTTQTLNYLCRIPLGKTLSYKEVSTALNNPRGARAVGNACKHNPFPLFIPCHRVIGSDGTLKGFSAMPGLEMKKYLLQFEGAV